MQQTIFTPKRSAQARASTPTACAWVRANAGSGKTFVLAQRVIRLLLNGHAPSRLLCLTFTNAAAAEMAHRIGSILAEWARMETAPLVRILEEQEERPVDAALVAHARRLFATALETPGGLRIQTLHGFCNGLLRQFSFEAGVERHFSILDSSTQEICRANAFRDLFEALEKRQDPELSIAFEKALTWGCAGRLQEAFEDLLSEQAAFQEWKQHYGDLKKALTATLLPHLGFSELRSSEEIVQALLSESPFASCVSSVCAALNQSGSSDRATATKLLASFSKRPVAERETQYWSVFLTELRQIRKNCPTKSFLSTHPMLQSLFVEEGMRVMRLWHERSAALTFQGTQALLSLADALLAGYTSSKRRRGCLDYADLIEQTVQLLARSDAAQWVHYKLDQGIDHILVDEAQDTTPQQWRIIQALSEEFFSGLSARTTQRTVFAVGDDKQSIYAFQGAAPDQFEAMRRFFKSKAEQAGKSFHDVALTLSFRSTPAVLSAIDQVFSKMPPLVGAHQTAPTHQAARSTEGGSVEIWPVVESPPSPKMRAKASSRIMIDKAESALPPGRDEGEDGRDSAARPPMRRPAYQILAEKIALFLDERIKRGLLSAGDVLILVRKRGAFVDALNRTLRRRAIPTAGQDRLQLATQSVIQDLCFLGEFVLCPADDLSLASLLKTPLFSFSEEDLFALAYGRTGRLWDALKEKAQQGLSSHSGLAYSELRERLEQLRRDGQRQTPFEFFSKILSVQGIRRKFQERLGLEICTILDAFISLTLRYEAESVPTLQGFLSWIKQTPTEIKRELSVQKNAIRIMTIHGAKGLESPLVVLVDGGDPPVQAQHDPILMKLSPESGSAVGDQKKETEALSPCWVWLPPKEQRLSLHLRAREQATFLAEEEYRRLLYVGMTRARDHLIICGWASSRGMHPKCWYRAIEEALVPQARPLYDQEGKQIAWQWRGPEENNLPAHTSPFTQAESVNAKLQISENTPSSRALPPWWKIPLDLPVSAQKVRPSAQGLFLDPIPQRAHGEELTSVATEESQKPKQTDAAIWGQVVHTLLEKLPSYPEEERAPRAAHLCRKLAPTWEKERQEAAWHTVQTLLEMPKYRHLLWGDGIAELPFLAQALSAEGHPLAISGRIDRLIPRTTDVLILDYKTTSFPPSRPGEVKEALCLQMALYTQLIQRLYPHQQIRGFFLWTHTAQLMEMPARLLERSWQKTGLKLLEKEFPSMEEVQKTRQKTDLRACQITPSAPL